MSVKHLNSEIWCFVCSWHVVIIIIIFIIIDNCDLKQYYGFAVTTVLSDFDRLFVIYRHAFPSSDKFKLKKLKV